MIITKNLNKQKISPRARYLHGNFDNIPIAETCTWPGTKYTGSGKDVQLLPCGKPTIGAGIFCDPYHRYCSYHSICERHKKVISDWAKP